jgi:hypothetical protein
MSQYNFFRNFGDLSGDSVVTDIYKKRIKAKEKRKNSKRYRHIQKRNEERR